MRLKHPGLVALFVLLFLCGDVVAQCGMCKAVVESNTSAGGNVAGGINEGIIYLMGVPYLLLGTVGYFVYRNYKKNSSAVNGENVL